MDDAALIAALIEREGTAVKVAELLGVKPQAVHNWKVRGGMPVGAQLRAWLALNHPVILRRWLAARGDE